MNSFIEWRHLYSKEEREEETALATDTGLRDDVLKKQVEKNGNAKIKCMSGYAINRFSRTVINM